MTHPAIATLSKYFTDREKCAVADLPPLYEAIDPEALTTLLDSDAAVTVQFEYAGAQVEIRSDPLAVSVIDDDR